MKAMGRPQKATKMWRSGWKSVRAQYILFSLVLSVVTSLVTNCIKIVGHLRADQNYGYMSSLARTLRLNIILFWLGWQMHILFVVNWGKKTHHGIQSPEVLLRTGRFILLHLIDKNGNNKRQLFAFEKNMELLIFCNNKTATVCSQRLYNYPDDRSP